jgi:hypothetical protein
MLAIDGHDYATHLCLYDALPRSDVYGTRSSVVWSWICCIVVRHPFCNFKCGRSIQSICMYDSFHFLFCSLWEVGVELIIWSIRGKEKREHSTSHHMKLFRLSSRSSVSPSQAIDSKDWSKDKCASMDWTFRVRCPACQSQLWIVISPQEIEVSHQSTDDGEGLIGALQKNRMGISSESHQRRDHPLATIQRIGSVYSFRWSFTERDRARFESILRRGSRSSEWGEQQTGGGIIKDEEKESTNSFMNIKIL